MAMMESKVEQATAEPTVPAADAPGETVSNPPELTSELQDLLLQVGLDAYSPRFPVATLSELLAKDGDVLHEMAEDAGMKRAERQAFLQLLQAEREARRLRTSLQQAGLEAFAQQLSNSALAELLAKDDRTLDELAEDAGMKRADRARFLHLVNSQRQVVHSRGAAQLTVSSLVRGGLHLECQAVPDVKKLALLFQSACRSMGPQNGENLLLKQFLPNEVRTKMEDHVGELDTKARAAQEELKDLLEEAQRNEGSMLAEMWTICKITNEFEKATFHLFKAAEAEERAEVAARVHQMIGLSTLLGTRTTKMRGNLERFVDNVQRALEKSTAHKEEFKQQAEECGSWQMMFMVGTSLVSVASMAVPAVGVLASTPVPIAVGTGAGLATFPLAAPIFAVLAAAAGMTGLAARWQGRARQDAAEQQAAYETASEMARDMKHVGQRNLFFWGAVADTLEAVRAESEAKSLAFDLCEFSGNAGELYRTVSSFREVMEQTLIFGAESAKSPLTATMKPEIRDYEGIVQGLRQKNLLPALPA